MTNRRVVVTGMQGITPIGSGWQELSNALSAGESGVCYMADWEGIDGLSTRLAAPIPGFCIPGHWSRKKTRSMGRVSALAVCATEQALAAAGLEEVVKQKTRAHRRGIWFVYRLYGRDQRLERYDRPR